MTSSPVIGFEEDCGGVSNRSDSTSSSSSGTASLLTCLGREKDDANSLREEHMGNTISSSNSNLKGTGGAPGRRSPLSVSPGQQQQPRRIVELSNTNKGSNRAKLTLALTSPISEKGGGGGGDSFFGSSSSPRSGFMIDNKLPSPRDLNRGKGRESRSSKGRAKSPFFVFTEKSGPDAAAKAGGEGAKKKEEGEWDLMKAIAKAVRRRRRGKTV